MVAFNRGRIRGSLKRARAELPMEMTFKAGHGFTLLEVLLALLLTAVLLAGIYNLFGSQEKSQLVVDQVAEMNQNLRTAANWVTRDLRMAGYHLEGATSTSGLGTLNAVTVVDGDPDDDTVPDTLTIIYADADVQTTITSPMPSASAELNVSSTDGFDDCDLVLITDGANTSMFCVTQVQDAALKLQHNPAGGTCGSPCGSYNDPGGHGTFPGYGTGSRLFKVVRRQYSVDSSDPDHPILMMQEGLGAAVPLVDYIENLQITPTTANSRVYTISFTARTRKPLTATGGIRRRTLTQQVRVRNIQ